VGRNAGQPGALRPQGDRILPHRESRRARRTGDSRRQRLLPARRLHGQPLRRLHLHQGARIHLRLAAEVRERVQDRIPGLLGNRFFLLHRQPHPQDRQAVRTGSVESGADRAPPQVGIQQRRRIHRRHGGQQRAEIRTGSRTLQAGRDRRGYLRPVQSRRPRRSRQKLRQTCGVQG